MNIEDKFHDQNDIIQRIEDSVYKGIYSLWVVGEMYPIYDLMFGENSNVIWDVEQEVLNKLRSYERFN